MKHSDRIPAPATATNTPHITYEDAMIAQPQRSSMHAQATHIIATLDANKPQQDTRAH
jgi:hypothetical protein